MSFKQSKCRGNVISCLPGVVAQCFVNEIRVLISFLFSQLLLIHPIFNLFLFLHFFFLIYRTSYLCFFSALGYRFVKHLLTSMSSLVH